MEIELKYTGSRPDISQNGISFKTGKEDKYVYINYAVDILLGIQKLQNNSIYTHVMDKNNFSDDEILSLVSKCEPKVKQNIEDEILKYEKHLDRQIEQISKQSRLKSIEKHAFIGNLKIMKRYRIQRAVNKIVYMHIIEAIIKAVRKKNIKRIETLFCEKLWHILHTIEGHIFINIAGVNAAYVIKEDKTAQSMRVELNFTHFN